MSLVFVSTKAIRYTGKEQKKFWEGGGRTFPLITSGDIIIVPELVAYTLCRKNKYFEQVKEGEFEGEFLEPEENTKKKDEEK